MHYIITLKQYCNNKLLVKKVVSLINTQLSRSSNIYSHSLPLHPIMIDVNVWVKENEVPMEKNSSRARVYIFSLQRQVIYQVKAKRLNYLIKDFILSNFKRRLSFLLSNSEVSSLLLKLQPFRVVKYSLPFYCI